eukprot:COSAG01_NODE_5930_length_3946_cov_9.547700_3_plen_125_part_01
MAEVRPPPACTTAQGAHYPTLSPPSASFPPSPQAPALVLCLHSFEWPRRQCTSIKPLAAWAPVRPGWANADCGAYAQPEPEAPKASAAGEAYRDASAGVDNLMNALIDKAALITKHWKLTADTGP